MTITIAKLESEDWFKTIKVFFYVAVSLGLAWLPVHFAHNNDYIALAAPINAFLVGLQKSLSQDEVKVEESLPVVEQAPVEAAVVSVEPPTEA